MRSLRNRYASLSYRERQVMALVVSGLLNKEAGAELAISEITVKAHRGQVMRKMKAESFADLIRMAARLRSELALVDRAGSGGLPALNIMSPNADGTKVSPIPWSNSVAFMLLA